jgi:signal transduction histidine kinase
MSDAEPDLPVTYPTPRAPASPLGLELGPALPRLLDAMGDAVVIVDRRGEPVARNRRFAETLGRAGRVIEGGPCPRGGRCAEADPGPGGPCAVCEIVRTREPRRALEALPDATGRQRRWEATLSPVLDPRGEVGLIVEVWRDVSERSRLEAQMSHSERLASLGLLAAGVAHEVNNPLASILAGVESLQRWMKRTSLPPAQADEANEVLELLERETRRCRETTDKLLLLGQPYSSRPTWVDLNRAVQDTLTLLSFATRQQGIEVAAELAPPLSHVWGREIALRGVLMNLCMNAVQAMPEGGRLTVRTSACTGERVRLEVQDTGPGIAAEHLLRIWDPFYTTKPVGQGTGLGLSISQQAIDRHGGEISVESTPGEGALFIVTLPTRGVGGENG